MLRVYELSEPVYCTRSRGMVFTNVDREVELDYNDPIVNDGDFELLKDEILGK